MFSIKFMPHQHGGTEFIMNNNENKDNNEMLSARAKVVSATEGLSEDTTEEITGNRISEFHIPSQGSDLCLNSCYFSCCCFRYGYFSSAADRRISA